MPQDLRAVVKQYDRSQEEQQAELLASQYGLPYINLVNYPFVADILGLIPEEAARALNVVAFMKIGNVVRAAAPNPANEQLVQYMQQLSANLGVTFEPHICSQSSINYALQRYPLLLPKIQKVIEEDRPVIQTLNDLQQAINKVGTTELLETIISGAVSLDASDVHFEPMHEAVYVRFRIDGKLLPVLTLPEKSYKLLSSRIMTNSHIKLDLRTIAQDGRMSVNIDNNPIDIRVNVLPSAYGQTIELRLLNYRQLLTLDQLLFPAQTLEAIRLAIGKPEGLVLFTGPTGSGKTSSLYAVLQLLNTPERKIITIEDPIEYRLEGIEQVQVDPLAGFDFPQALRAVLRQDPNVIMVGEIRDHETADIAVNASLTGHLVLSTLHTNSAAASFSRLIQMGVPKYLLADSVSLIVAQRLVRKLCTNCQGGGCEVCHQTGYKGRLLIAEHLLPDTNIIELIKREASLSEFQQYFTTIGNKSLFEDGLLKVSQGLTTEAEVRSVVG
ncbi:type II/IV secretion system protein [Candidatus Berkelbacteria bacterium]|nr:type II/IV secretion system protein [Candidatus Berkelbacteria bacterium]